MYINKKALWYVLLAIVVVGVVMSLKADKNAGMGSATLYDAIYPPADAGTAPIYPPTNYIYPPADAGTAPIYPPAGYIYPPADPYTGYVMPTTDYIYPPTAPIYPPIYPPVLKE